VKLLHKEGFSTKGAEKHENQIAGKGAKERREIFNHGTDFPSPPLPQVGQPLLGR
jgi:hypothetical protein